MGSHTRLTNQESINHLLEDLFPSEEPLDASYFNRDFWLLDEFCALMSGISPEKHKKIMKNTEENLTELDIKCSSDAHRLYKRFLRYLDEIHIAEKTQIRDNDFCMSPWKFIKWTSKNGIQIKRRFLHALPLYLLEIYFEFLPDNSPLRTKPKSSRAYHETLYLKNARELINKTPHRLSRKQIYFHSRMQSVLRQIRALGGWSCPYKTGPSASSFLFS